ncbi:MAG: serine/threonine protein kinase [Gammaproteobacteria bacterium]|nr:serine/threonine protein kinase [Gammaproteobacteria bacterium]
MKSIAGYNVIKLLAKGGMSAIYLAEQQSLQRQVVLKFLNPKLDAEVKKRFIDEGQIIASLKHPNIITVFDVISTGKHNFISMEYLPDGDLESRLQNKLDTFSALSIMSKISDALHAVHKQGIIHGDIKPANILFRSTGCPLLTDFGISHRIEPKKEVDLSSDDLYASPTYASPELIQGKPFDYRTDLYSLGIMLYEMLLGEKPFKGETEIETIANSIQKPVPQLPDAIKELQPLLESLLAKSPDDRLSDAKLVTRFIEQYLKDHPEVAKQGADTKLIDTDVVVEYVAKNKDKKTIIRKSNHLNSLILILILLLTVLLNKERLWDQYIASDNIKSSQPSKTVIHPSEKVTTIKKEDIPLSKLETDIEEEFHQLTQQELFEQQKALEKKNEELALIKKELEDQKDISRQKGNNKKRSINQLLSKGKTSLKKYQLTTPLNDNALYYFQKVLELDKDNLEAKKGIKDVVYRYELLARSEIDKYNYQKAQSFISSGLSIEPDNERLIALQKEANLHNEPKRVINKVKGFFKNL